MTVSSMERHDVEQVATGGLVHLEYVTSFLATEQEDRPPAPFEGAGFDAIIHDGTRTRISVVDPNAFTRTCLMRCLKVCDADFIVDAYRNLAEWQLATTRMPGATILLCATGQRSTETVVHHDLPAVIEMAPAAGVIIVSDFEDPSVIADALEAGARGFISMNCDVDIAVAAIRLVKAGGIFVPASSLLALRSLPPVPFAPGANERSQGPFTQRELDVITYLRKGESNKLIAYKLGLGECTVKVHVRNVMRKTKARTRTEIAFLTNDLFNGRTKPFSGAPFSGASRELL